MHVRMHVRMHMHQLTMTRPVLPSIPTMKGDLITRKRRPPGTYRRMLSHVADDPFAALFQVEGASLAMRFSIPATLADRTYGRFTVTVLPAVSIGLRTRIPSVSNTNRCILPHELLQHAENAMRRRGQVQSAAPGTGLPVWNNPYQ